MTSIKNNALILLASTFVGIITQIIQFVLLGRLLTPEQMGIASIVLVVVVFAQMFTDFGLSGYYVHRQSAEKTEKSTLYWLNVGLGFAVGIVVLAVAPIIAYFYQNSSITVLVSLCALSFPIIAAGSQFQAYLLKTFRYKRIVAVEIITRLVALSVFAMAIWIDADPIVVVIGHLAMSIVKTLLLLVLVPRSEYPSFVFDRQYVHGGLSYGSYLIMGQFLNQVTANLDKILIGKFIGLSSLGTYTLAKDLAMRAMQVINPMVNKLCLPKYAQAQNDQNELNLIVSNTLLVLGFFSSIIFIGIAHFAELIVQILYGSGKEDIAKVLSIIAFYVLFRSFGNISGTLLNAVGQTKRDFQWNICAALIALPTIFTLVQFSFEYMVAGIVLLQLCLTLVSYFIIIKPILSMSFMRYCVAVVLFPAIGIAIGIPVSTMVGSDTLQLILSFLLWLALYVAVAFVLYKTLLRKFYVS